MDLSAGIQKIIDNSKASIETHHGHIFHVSPSGAKLLKTPSWQKLKVFSVSQIINFVKQALATADLTKDHLVVNIVDHENVDVITPGVDENKEIQILAAADFSDIYHGGIEGSYLSQDEFILGLMKGFVRDSTLIELIQFVSSVRSGKLMTSVDDGYSQEVNVKAGITLVNQAPAQNFWTLTAFKTFPEISQPEIGYVLRLKQAGEEVPKFALHEADGGQWKVKTTLALREYINTQLATALGDKMKNVVVL